MPASSTRSAGVLLHPTSLPSPHGIGDFGAEATRFVDWLADAGVKWWQILPLVPPGPGDSPYSSWSAQCGSPWMIDLRDLADGGLLDDLPRAQSPHDGPVDYEAVKALKAPRLKEAAERLLATPDHPWRPALEAFRTENPWVEDAALFYALHVHSGDQPWWRWPAALRDRQPKAMALMGNTLKAEIDEVVVTQFFFERQWQRLKAYANSKGVGIIGDVPIYVDWDSVDVWCNREIFHLSPEGERLSQAGVPPDAFSATGQLWGNPTYRWDVLDAGGYQWWIDRMRRVLTQVDKVRIDHFRGFAAYWSVPADAEDARSGHWIEGPGTALFDALRAAFGDLPIIAEDLGIIDDAVVALRDAVGLPGMNVLHFAFGEGPDQPYLPHNHVPNAVVYTGTHDNDTTGGWWTHAPEHVRDHVRRYFAFDGHDVIWRLMQSAFASVCDLAVVPMQDLLFLGTEARMNVPSKPSGNWSWRMPAYALSPDRAANLRHMVGLYGR
ncbi:MAG: 4-alpha-glucanotransferase [Bradymonadia bacterium]